MKRESQESRMDENREEGRGVREEGEQINERRGGVREERKN